MVQPHLTWARALFLLLKCMTELFLAWFFLFFLVSGFCSVLYEIVWLRLSMAQFGVTSALVAIVLSMFMAGLGLGSWLSGRLIRRHESSLNFSALRLYAAIELLIGCSALLVPLQLEAARGLLQQISVSSSGSYHLLSGFAVAITVVPWCGLMGATIPVAMWALRQLSSTRCDRSFSFLYLANVCGAVLGAILPLFLIELYGFRGTLKIGALLNAMLAVAASVLAQSSAVNQNGAARVSVVIEPARRSYLPLLLLFATGLTSMGMEVVWIREFTPYLNTVVYAFGAILGVYLISTFAGSQAYRWWSRKYDQENRLVWAALGLLAVLPIVAANPHFLMARTMRLALGIMPFSTLLGFLTPMLVDRWSSGDPDRAGTAYAFNILGCILGPLLAGFILLPLTSERWVLFMLALPWLCIGFSSGSSGRLRLPRADVWSASAGLASILAAAICFSGTTFEDQFSSSQILRDNTATIIATGTGMDKRLLVNGVGITGLSPVTKVMAHLPMAFLGHPAHNSLVICFGMGTTYRSLLSWGVPATAVELVPSVPRMFSYYHADGPALLQSSYGHIVIDDGRRYLERSSEQFDVITLDPPPPVEAAASSLLYSKEFYAAVKPRLREDGILQQWLPMGDTVVHAAVARALKESFLHVRVFHTLNGWGYHFLASDRPLHNWDASDLAQQMPPAAAADFTEWGPSVDAEGQFAILLKNELSVDSMIAESPQTPALHDDHPANEYYAIRRNWLNPARWYLIR